MAEYTSRVEEPALEGWWENNQQQRRRVMENRSRAEGWWRTEEVDNMWVRAGGACVCVGG